MWHAAPPPLPLHFPRLHRAAPPHKFVLIHTKSWKETRRGVLVALEAGPEDGDPEHGVQVQRRAAGT